MNKLVFALFFLLYTIRAFYVLDPDFGWHIRMGQIMLREGIPATDQLSYTMSHYPVIDHEWLTNLLFAVLHPSIGMQGLAIAFSLLTLLAIIVVYSFTPKNQRRFAGLPLFLSCAVMINFTAIRPQVITWVIFAVLISVLFSASLYKKWGKFLPLLFLPWVNLHGAFASGIAVLAIAVFVKSIEKKRIQIHDTQIFLISILITFINPYGIRIWHEVWMQITDSALNQTISEWYPAVFISNFFYWLLVGFSGFFIVRYRKRYTGTELSIYGMLLIAGLLSMRHIPLWVIAALPLSIKALSWFSDEAVKIKRGFVRFVTAYKFLFGIFLFMFVLQLMLAFRDAYKASEKTFYPTKATAYLKKHPQEGRIFAPFEWNGYLVWKLPGKRVFIHGMMPSWRGHTWMGESDYAFREYQDILLGREQLGDVVQKYAINTFLLPKAQPPQKDIFADLRLQVERNHWKIVYTDKTSIIYVSP